MVRLVICRKSSGFSGFLWLYSGFVLLPNKKTTEVTYPFQCIFLTLCLCYSTYFAAFWMLQQMKFQGNFYFLFPWNRGDRNIFAFSKSSKLGVRFISNHASRIWWNFPSCQAFLKLKTKEYTWFILCKILISLHPRVQCQYVLLARVIHHHLAMVSIDRVILANIIVFAL